MHKLEFQHQNFYDLVLLNEIKTNPDVTQALLAETLYISVGSVNGRLKRMVEDGLIVAKQARRRKLRYIITAEGIALHDALTQDYLQQSFQLFRQVRQRAQALLKNLDGVNAVRLLGEGDVVEVCRLTCLENQVSLTNDRSAPAIVIDGLEIGIAWPENAHRV